MLLGPPGVGKGTQAALLSPHLGACHLSTGDLFRAARDLAPSRRTPALTTASEMIRRGHLASDEVVVDLVRERSDCLRCEGGVLLDGFPRTVQQADALDAMLSREGLALDAVVGYDLPVQLLVERLGGRRVCGECRAVYHVDAQPPTVAGICDRCGGAIHAREDDSPEAVHVRMPLYEACTKPLIEYYAARGLLRPVSGAGTPAEVFARTLDALGADAAGPRSV